jgi:hypothetical protein
MTMKNQSSCSRTNSNSGFAARRRFRVALGLSLVAAGATLHCGNGDDSSAPVPSSDAGMTVDSSLPSDAMSVADGPSEASEASTGDGAAPSIPCSSLPGTVVYIESGDTQENLLKVLGRQLRDDANITIAFNLTGSCTLTADIYGGAKVVKSGTLKYIPSTAEDPSWTPAQAEATCTTDATGVPVDVAISALFVDSCGLGPTPAGLSLIQGPIQAYTFIVPTASDQNAIWAEEAYYAFGFGTNNPLATGANPSDPWNNPMFMFIRPTTKSTLVATAKNIDLPPSNWMGVQESASSDVVNAVTNSAMPEPTIGILGAEVYDADRNKGIKTLAFQAFNQSGAFYPDSASSAFDKQNLRDGHYTLWSPTVYITPVGDGSAKPTNPAVEYITDLVLGNTPTTAPDASTAIDGLADVVGVGLIPECAMHVTRSTDGGDLSPYTAPTTCDCYYMSKIPGATGVPDGCTVCTKSSDCSAPGATCNYGFCEPFVAATPPPDDSGACFSGTPTTNAEIINACTESQSIFKSVTLPTTADGGLEPLP